ncbi:ADP-ribosyltransferase [Fictibacillus gelatini]|uniref:ADP-ribosyltransferase n=1 Tax=Fictibacillus gelatini TaxID=225985 RepID=UPI0009D79968|nr:ADP-ribosyltransferase [Fictibacillus gelatini]
MWTALQRVLLGNTSDFCVCSHAEKASNRRALKSSIDYNLVSWTINVPKGANGAYVAKISHYPNEAEFLFNSGQEMIIRDAKLDPDGKIHLVLDLM